MSFNRDTPCNIDRGEGAQSVMRESRARQFIGGGLTKLCLQVEVTMVTSKDGCEEFMVDECD